MTDLVRAPWTTEQVQALNDFQEHGKMHPLTCGAIHASGRSPVLDATHSGWICPDPECTYTQDWAHAFMTQPTARTAARQTTGQDDACNACGSPFPVGHLCLNPEPTAPAVGQPAEAHDTEQLVPVGWWCWRGNDHGHLADIPCRSDNVPIHVPAEWADEMRAVIQHLTDDHDPGEDCTWVTPEEQAAETLAAADTVEGER